MYNNKAFSSEQEKYEFIGADIVRLAHKTAVGLAAHDAMQLTINPDYRLSFPYSIEFSPAHQLRIEALQNDFSEDTLKNWNHFENDLAHSVFSYTYKLDALGEDAKKAIKVFQNCSLQKQENILSYIRHEDKFQRWEEEETRQAFIQEIAYASVVACAWRNREKYEDHLSYRKRNAGSVEAIPYDEGIDYLYFQPGETVEIAHKLRDRKLKIDTMRSQLVHKWGGELALNLFVSSFGNLDRFGEYGFHDRYNYEDPIYQAALERSWNQIHKIQFVSRPTYG